MTVAAACGFLGLGFMAGALVTEKMWWLLAGPLPRPWRHLAAGWRLFWAGLPPAEAADGADPWA